MIQLTKEFDLNKYSKLFVSESREYLRSLNEAVIALESSGEDKELIDQMFRACHTLKGMASMMNLTAISETAHAMEDILAAIRDGDLSVNEAVVEGIFKGIDGLEAMVSEVERTLEVGDNPDLLINLRSLTNQPQETKKTSKKKVPAVEGKATPKGNVISIRLARRCALPSARAIVIMKELEKGASILSMTPSENDIENERPFDELVIEVDPADNYREVLSRIANMTDVEQLLEGETGTQKNQLKRVPKQEKKTKDGHDASLVQTVKVGMDKLDELLDDVGELVIGRSRLVEMASSSDDYELQDISSLIDSLTSGIQAKVLGIRMIPLDYVMSRFPRMVRDLAKSQTKEAEFVVEGGNIELDRTVVDRISEPIIHIIRNAVDHGIEMPDERVKAGKNPKGLIRVVASKQQDHVLIEITDDGQGLDFDRLRQSAVSKGFMTKDRADAALGRELIELMFLPGFTTKTEVSETSGRGVGLDVVKKGVENLGGSVMMSTSKGAGTTISLWLPFTLAIIDAMMISIRGQIYAAPMSSVVESHCFQGPEVRLIRNREVVQLRGEVLPLIDMYDFFSLELAPKKESINTLIVQSRERRAAIRVDELIGHQQIVVKSLDKHLRNTRGISGGTILGSGKIALILDVDSILGD
ncbi:MAG: chemotaxis protein CheA [Thermoplasmata archaeon]|nr:chemotaxis protein CheA [Thermoplasmata archaeon]MCJ7561896.1 chemotaxis protein CheA [Thermoplasmata archaeon]TFG70864.1 MAG: chemotaxis protein CheA [Methanomassiliicoccus sp.]